MDKITEIKATVFDILRRQAAFQLEIQNLEKLKEQKIQELQAEERKVAKQAVPVAGGTGAVNGLAMGDNAPGSAAPIELPFGPKAGGSPAQKNY